MRRSVLLTAVIVLCLAFGPLVVKLIQARIALGQTAGAWKAQEHTNGVDDAAREGLSQLLEDSTLEHGLTSATAAAAEHVVDPDARQLDPR